MDYLKRTGRVSPEIMLKAENYLNIGYQKILTFERPGGGFDWWGRDSALVWLTAYGMQQLSALSKVKEIDTGVIQRATRFLLKNQQGNGSWSNIGGTHGESISHVANPTFALTSYVTWSLAKSGNKNLSNSCDYIKQNIDKAKGNPYLLSLAANALLSVNPKDNIGLLLLEQLEEIKTEDKDSVFWDVKGKTASYAYGRMANVETTALAILAMLESRTHSVTATKALKFIIKSKTGNGTWGSTQSTILALQCLVSSEKLQTAGGDATISVIVNKEKVATWSINDKNRDVMQILDLQKYTKTGKNLVQFEVAGNPNVMYQIITRHYEPWAKTKISARPTIDLNITYDRTTLSQHDTIIATANLKYFGNSPTYMVIIDLGIPPGFSVNPGDFAELLSANKIKRYSITSTQVTLYLGNVKPKDDLAFRYMLKAKYPLKVKTPKSTAYEYYSPDIKAESKPILLEVKE